MPDAKPRYDGPFKVVNLDLNEPMNYLQEQIFVNTHHSEQWHISLRRLTDALRADGERELRPCTIWAAYRLHKELGHLTKS